MVRYFLTYPPCAEEAAIVVHDDLAEAGLVNSREDNNKETDACKAADFLFVLLTEPTQIDLPEIRKIWELFDNEIRWKRKPMGEILFLVPDDGALKNLPLRLRNCGYYLLNEAADAARYCLEKMQEAEEREQQKMEAASPVKQIKYSPAAQSVQQIEFSVRAPRVESFDGSVNVPEEGKQSTHSAVCKKDHVFDEMLQRDIVKQQQEQKKSRVGCCLAFVILFIFVAVAMVIVIAVTTQTNAVTGFALQNADFLAAPCEKARIFDGAGAYAVAANALQATLACAII